MLPQRAFPFVSIPIHFSVTKQVVFFRYPLADTPSSFAVFFTLPS